MRPAGRRDTGQVIVIFVLALVALMAAAGLAIDIGRFYSEKRFLQNAADATALAVANKLILGGSEAEARAEGLAVLTHNYSIPPNGVAPPLPPGAGGEVYDAGHAGDPLHLVDGILISGDSVRVAIRNTISYTFGRAVGLTTNTIGGKARVRLKGNLLPIAVRRYVNAPGSGTGVYPCVDDQTAFMDFFATADTACLGTDTGGGRTNPNPGAAFSSTTPDNDRANHGPIVEILGQGADPDNGADFRGYIALDIRNFANSSSQLYYNGVAPSTTMNTLKDMEARWILDGGYPGPALPPAVTPPDPNDQIATMDGNSAGIAIDAIADRFVAGNEIMVAVYPGVTMQFPDFSMTSPATIAAPTTGELATAGTFRVSRNAAFSGVVALSTVADAGDPGNPMLLGQLDGGANPIDYTPNPVTPSLGMGTPVTMLDLDVNGATPGIYALWIRGEAGSPYLTVKYQPASLKIGTVSRDFTITSDVAEQTAVNVGDTVAFTLNLKRSGAVFGSGVALTLEALPGETLPAGLGAVSFSPASVTPTAGTGTNSALTINTGSVPPGQYDFVVRATGLNGDPTPRTVTHLLPLRVNVATASVAGRQEYVDIVGFAVMRVVGIDANTITAYAITPMIADPSDFRLRRGQVARLAPWN